MASLYDTAFGSPEEDEKADEAMAKYLEQMEGIPEFSLDNIVFDEADLMGPAQTRGYNPNLIDELDPTYAEGYDAATVDGTGFDDISVDPRLRQAQLDALTSLQEIGKSGGLTAQDRARMAQIESQEATADRGRREAIMQNMRARGMGGSGNDLLAQLQSAQAATDNSNVQGLEVEGMAQQRTMDALAGAGQLGGNIRGQDFGEQSRIADARDAMSRFSAQNTQQARQFGAGARNQMRDSDAGRTLAVRQGNQGARNDASRFGADWDNQSQMDFTGRQQDVENARVGVRNQAKIINQIENPTAMYDKNMQGRQMRAGAYQDMANMYGQRGDRVARTKAGMWEAGGKLGAAAIASDERKKKEKASFTSEDISEFLSSVKPATFKYKDESDPGSLPGKRIGFMAQDVKDTKLGKDLVSKRDDGTLQYDPENLQGIMLAALSDLEKKGKK